MSMSVKDTKKMIQDHCRFKELIFREIQLDDGCQKKYYKHQITDNHLFKKIK